MFTLWTLISPSGDESELLEVQPDKSSIRIKKITMRILWWGTPASIGLFF
jgi:hypothetical protein